MLSGRDKELARRIGREVRHGSYPTIPSMGLSGPVAWACATATGGIAYLLKDFHWILWGAVLSLAASSLMYHAIYRKTFVFTRRGDAAFLCLYMLAFGLGVRELIASGYYLLGGLIGFFGFATIVGLVASLFSTRD